MATILSGEDIAAQLLKEVAKGAKEKALKLAVIQVGVHPASEKYINEKRKAAEEAGIDFILFQYREDTAEQFLKDEVQKIAQDPAIQGMIIQLPLPRHLNREKLLNLIPLEKDIDVLSSGSFKRFEMGKSRILPPTVYAISLLLKHLDMNLQGIHAAVLGAGRLVGLPVSLWLSQQGAKVDVILEATEGKEQILKDADLVVSGVGKKDLLKGSMIKKGSVVIDAGTSVETGKTSGDVEFESVSRVAKAVSPVPGGVGPLTVACVLDNLITLSHEHS